VRARTPCRGCANPDIRVRILDRLSCQLHASHVVCRRTPPSVLAAEQLVRAGVVRMAGELTNIISGQKRLALDVGKILFSL
jgi:hypothetical protein